MNVNSVFSIYETQYSSEINNSRKRQDNSISLDKQADSVEISDEARLLYEKMQSEKAAQASGSKQSGAEGESGSKGSGGASGSSSSDSSETDQVTQLEQRIKQLSDQVANVMSSSLPTDIKTQQAAPLNQQLAGLQQQLQQLQQAQAKAQSGKA